ncbi:MAG: hypothetical protein Q7U56_08840 [Humidesulfovibrio sp.]|nr:hypothetical protein [Humidesulfovibrio sp.]
MYTVIGRLVVYGVFLVGIHQAFHHRSAMKSWLQNKISGDQNDKTRLEAASKYVDEHNNKYRNWSFAAFICGVVIFIEYVGGK